MFKITSLHETLDDGLPRPIQARTSAPAAIIGAPKQARTYAADAKASPTEVSSILEQRIRGVQEEAGLAETGRVLSVGCVSWNTNTYRRDLLCWV